MNKKPGIYQIINLRNGKMYIGSSINITNRVGAHKNHLKRGTHYNKHLQCAWNKYGEDAFEFRKIINCNVKDLLEAEQYWIDYYLAEYNQAPTAGSNKGTKHSEETKRKMSLAQLGKKKSIESIIKRTLSRKGFQHSESTKHKFAERRHSEVTRIKMSVSAKLRYRK